jgi:hypothetical protein
MSIKRQLQKQWARMEVRASLLAVVVAVLGLAWAAAALWAGLMLWNRDFRRNFGDWYTKCVLVGLVAAALLDYPISTPLNIPPSWVAVVLVGGSAYVGLRGQRARRRSWR